VEQIASIFAPFVSTENERHTVIAKLFAGSTSKLSVDTAGTPLEFARLFVVRLIDYGESEPGKSALWSLLELIRTQVDIDKQTSSDKLILCKIICWLICHRFVNRKQKQLMSQQLPNCRSAERRR